MEIVFDVLTYLEKDKWIRFYLTLGSAKETDIGICVFGWRLLK